MSVPGDGVRPVEPRDVPVLLQLVRELAIYEREPDAVHASEPLLATALFEQATCSAHVAVYDGEVVGFALWYPTFSTWTGQPGLWLEDLFVRASVRGSGLGRALLEALAAVCVARGWRRFEWWVLDWNSPAHGFYRALGAVPQQGWTTWRVDGAALEQLAAGSSTTRRRGRGPAGSGAPDQPPAGGGSAPVAADQHEP